MRSGRRLFHPPSSAALEEFLSKEHPFGLHDSATLTTGPHALERDHHALTQRSNDSATNPTHRTTPRELDMNTAFILLTAPTGGLSTGRPLTARSGDG
jgi:hypothetical protein